jgi:hypothetical protein
MVFSTAFIIFAGFNSLTLTISLGTSTGAASLLFLIAWSIFDWILPRSLFLKYDRFWYPSLFTGTVSN